MTKFISAILLFSFTSGYCQIPMKKLVPLAGNKYSIVSEFLMKDGWEFKGSDTTDGLHNIWTLGYNDTTKSAVRWLYCFFKNFPTINKDSISNIVYMNVSHDEYLYFFNNLASLGFGPAKTTDFQGDLSTIYKKILKKEGGFIVIELSQFVIRGSDSRKTKYQISVARLD